jgi:hypothetical protein
MSTARVDFYYQPVGGKPSEDPGMTVYVEKGATVKWANLYEGEWRCVKIVVNKINGASFTYPIPSEFSDDLVFDVRRRAGDELLDFCRWVYSCETYLGSRFDQPPPIKVWREQIRGKSA